MNDHAAVEAINAVLDAWLGIELTAVEALHKIAHISGMNRTEHEGAKA